jgi:lactate permease
VARYTAILLGIASLFCGLAVANIFKRLDRWFAVIALSGVMGTVQYLCTVYRLPALAGFLAGASGVAGAMLINQFLLSPVGASRLADSLSLKLSPPLVSALVSYGSLALIMAAINLIPPLRQELAKLVWSVSFPQVETLNGFVTAAKHNQTYQPLLHPGASIILVSSFSFWLNKNSGLYQSTDLRKILTLTFKSALPAMMGIISMVGLSSLMDHTGMNLLLAQLLSSVFYGVFPLVSPLIGMLGAFATGSNNNSNVLFASMQEGIALILKLSPGIIIAAQTTGGSLGSMIAPAKIIVGLSTVNQPGRDGDVLRQTLPYGLIIGLIMGVITLILTSFF